MTALHPRERPAANGAVTRAPSPIAAPVQASLFDAEPLAPLPGLLFMPDFLSVDEEAALLALIQDLPLKEARYKQYTARRRVAGWGGRYDYESNTLQPAPPIPPEFEPLQARVAGWLGIEPGRFEHMLVAEYRPGTPLGWHRDVPDFESIVGLSLAGPARLKLRPWPPARGRNPAVRELVLPPRSLYVLEGEARWGWQHAIAETETLRYSVTLRTLRGAPPLLAG